MYELTPKKVFFTTGVGKHKNYLQSFECALRSAGIEKQNLVTVSSILPPKCEIISVEDGLQLLSPGSITFCVMARNASNEVNRLVSSSVGVAIPADRSTYGYLSEHHPYGEDMKTAGDYAEDLAATMLAETLGVAFNPDTDWSDREQTFKMCEQIVETKNFTASSFSDKGEWCTVIASAVFIF